MKKIALLTDGWRKFIVYAWAEGIMRKIRKENLDMVLFQFNCFGNWSSDRENNQGEYNIFNLPDLTAYDGIVIDANNITDYEVLQKLIRMVRESGKPAVSIGHEFPGLYYVGIDNRKPIEEIMDHLYNVHNCRSFVFAGGPGDNFENRQRAESYLDCLQKYQLTELNNPVLYGDYEFATGVRYMNDYIKNHKPFPDVFVCSNDNIATGICRTAELNGYHVPGDFLVTGFDNLEKARNYLPQITTVNMDRELIGERALEILIDLWEGREVSSHTYTDANVIFAESCGCPNSGMVDYRNYLKSVIDSNCAKEVFDNEIACLERDVLKEPTMHDMFDTIEKYMCSKNVEGFFAVVDERIFEPYMSTHFPTEGYSRPDLKVQLAVCNGKRTSFESVEDLIGYIDHNLKGVHYLFNPIHFGNEAVGYTLHKNPVFLYEWSNLLDMQEGIIEGFKNLFHKKQLTNAMKQLEDVYNKDQLTGVFNRIALTDIVESRFNRERARGIIWGVVFVDADNFKTLNDRYGHEYGDKVLKIIAKTMKKHVPEGGDVFRFGGDEFVALFPNASRGVLKSYREKVVSELEQNDTAISMGSCLTNMNMTLTLADYISAADGSMYLDKNDKG
ncbi:diguanylate cyclase (GGDEF) domain-containing protein [Butyrivibrio sp. TB]|nr:diguanylate cyclase (GGDEF) domain-containing protein [Butyrivibrio sp. TB]